MYRKETISKIGWPYIRIYIKDVDMKVSLTSEYMDVPKGSDIYTLILRAYAEMGPRWIF